MTANGTAIGKALTRELGPDRVAEDAATLAAHQTDYWILAHLRARQGRLGAGPACVVRPQSTAEVATALRVAQRHGVAVVPYGSGSGVVGGATPPAGALVIDLGRMDRLLEVNETALTARVQAGMNGAAYEAAVQARGYTTGNYPQSIALSTVGGWVATRAAGQFSTRYGNIEDLCLGLEAVRPSGEIVRLEPVPRASVGPQLRELFLGSEGTLGVITEVTFRLHPLPERREIASFAFPGMTAALDAVRRILRVGWRPAVLRAYDPLETGRHFSKWAPADSAILIVVSEGPATLVTAEMAACADVATAGGGSAVGTAPAAHWLETRNTVPAWDFFLDREMLADTIEVAATWDRIPRLYETVVAALASAPGVIVASGHSSHGYVQGTNIYFTFVLKPADFAHAEDDYLEAWGRALRATMAAGGTISHHHGIGRLRTPWLEQELRSAYPLLRDLKRALDPGGLMNPGVLVPPAAR
jgi:alkyldihydroxyacetonephosphate synthase